MKMKKIAKSCCALLLVFCVTFSANPARADVITDIVGPFLNVLDMAQANPLPVTGDQLIAADPLISCIIGGTDVVTCTAQNEDALSSLGADPGILSMIIDFIMAVQNHDFWGIVEAIGLDGGCALIKIVTQVDVCGLIKDLVQLGEDLYDVGKALYDFFSDLGADAINALESLPVVGGVIKSGLCDIGIGSCDSPPPPPPYAVAYVQYFQPSVSAGKNPGGGLRAIEAATDVSFNQLYNTLYGQAWSGGFDQGSVQIAAGNYKKAVDDQWTGDLMQVVLPDRALKQQAYNTPQIVASEAQFVWQSIASEPNWGEYQYMVGSRAIPDRCRDRFVNQLGYAHVDRWVSLHLDVNKQYNVQTNSQWCANGFWKTNQMQFATAFHGYLNGVCPQGSGNVMACSTVKDFMGCNALMTDIGQPTACTFSSAVAKLALDQVVKDLSYTTGTTLNCTSTVYPQAGKAADYSCPRPYQKWQCDQKYQTDFAGVPVRLVNCVFKEDPQYAALLAQATKTVATLNAKYPGGPWLTETAYDPLVWNTGGKPLPQGLYADLAKSYGFTPPSQKPGFDMLAVTPMGACPIGNYGVSTPSVCTGGGMPKQSVTTVSAQARLQQGIQAMKQGGSGGVGPLVQPGPDGANAQVSAAGGAQQFSTAISNYAKASTSWKGLAAGVQAPTARCACGGTFDQIGTMDKNGAALIKEGDALSASLNEGKLDAAAAGKANDRLNAITTELNGSMSARTALATQYANQLKAGAAMQQQQKR